MTTTIAIILFLVFLFLSSIHFYWAFGGQWGKDAAVPTKDSNIKVFEPGLLSTLIVAIGLLFFGLIVLKAAKEFNLSPFHWPALLSKYGPWTIAGIFSIRAIGDFKYVGFFKKHRHTKFAKNDTKYYSPLCLIIGILTLVLIFS